MLTRLGIASLWTPHKQGSGVAQPCAPVNQRTGLLVFYNSTNGPGWTNNTGWPAPKAPLPPLQSGVCMGGNGDVLPDHCCWFGVSCCSCDAAATSCLCTEGLVTGLSLSANNVRLRETNWV